MKKMKFKFGDREFVYGGHGCPTIEVSESEIFDWPGSIGVLKVRLVNADESKECFFHISAAVKNSRPRIVIEDSGWKKKSAIGKFKKLRD
jgi:hypothetical protein